MKILLIPLYLLPLIILGLIIGFGIRLSRKIAPSKQELPTQEIDDDAAYDWRNFLSGGIMGITVFIVLYLLFGWAVPPKTTIIKVIISGLWAAATFGFINLFDKRYKGLSIWKKIPIFILLLILWNIFTNFLLNF